MRRLLSEQVAVAAFNAGLVSHASLHVRSEPGAKAIHHAGYLVSKPVVIKHFADGGSGGVDAVKRAAVASGLVIDSESEAKGFANDVERVIPKG